MGMLARLGVVLGLDSAEFQKGIADANRKLDNISAQMPKFAAIAGAAFLAATYKALQYADAVADTAKANDMAISSILALGTALQQNGGDAQMAGRLLSSFTAQVDEAAEGSLGAQKAFAKVGITLNDLAKLDATALFDKTVVALARIEDPIQRNALAMQMFGKAAKGVDWVGMADNVEENRQAYEKYAESIAKAAELNDKLEETTKKFTLAFTEAALPALNDLFDTLNKDAGAMKFFMDIVRTTTEVVAVLVKYTSTVVRILIEDFKFLGQIIGRVFKLEFQEMANDYKAYKEKVEAMVKSDEDFARRVLNREQAGGDKPKSIGGKGFVGRQVTPAKDPEAEKAKKLAESLEKARGITAEFEKQQQLNLEQAALRAQLNGLATKEREVAESVLRVKEQTASQLKDIDLKIIDATIEKNNEMVDVLRKVREEVELSGKSFEEKTANQTIAIQNAQNTFSFGWNKAFRQYAEDSENYMKKGEQMFNAVTNNMNNAIDNFVENGKFSFKDFATSIIKDLLKIEMKMQAMQLFRMGLSFFGLTGGAPTAGGKASGGQVGSGLPYMVGEQGPELFVPNSAGTIIPNNRLSETLTGGSGQVINYNGPYVANLSAIDTQSATQFLAKNKMAVWSANQSAGRSVPTSR